MLKSTFVLVLLALLVAIGDAGAVVPRESDAPPPGVLHFPWGTSLVRVLKEVRYAHDAEFRLTSWRVVEQGATPGTRVTKMRAEAEYEFSVADIDGFVPDLSDVNCSKVTVRYVFELDSNRTFRLYQTWLYFPDLPRTSMGRFLRFMREQQEKAADDTDPDDLFAPKWTWRTEESDITLQFMPWGSKNPLHRKHVALYWIYKKLPAN